MIRNDYQAAPMHSWFCDRTAKENRVMLLRGRVAVHLCFHASAAQCSVLAPQPLPAYYKVHVLLHACIWIGSVESHLHELGLLLRSKVPQFSDPTHGSACVWSPTDRPPEPSVTGLDFHSGPSTSA